MHPRRIPAARTLFTVLVAALATMLGLPIATANDIHESGTGGGSYDYIKDAGTSSEHSLGQGFVTSSQFAGERVHHIAVYLERVGTAENACVWLTLRSQFDGGDLAHKCVNAASVPTTAGWVDFVFDSPVPITPGGTYFFVVRYYGSCDTCMRMHWANFNSYRDTNWPTVKYGQTGTSYWQAPGTDLTFLLAVDHTPIVTTQAATGVGSTSATLNGSNDEDGGDGPDMYFDYGTTTSYGSTTGASFCAQGTTCGRSVGGLLPSTLYHYRACATNDSGTQCGADRTFTTTAGSTNNPPNTPSGPAPSHGATGVSTGTGLGWAGGDPDGHAVTYDVYLSAGSSATTLRCSATSSTTCPNGSLGGLAAGTSYAWRVVARDSLGAVTNGPTWSFTTAAGNSPPNTPSSPSPANAAGNVSTGTGVSWVGGDPNGHAVTYDVYLNAGSSATTLRCSATSSTTCPNGSLGGLAAGTSYAWRVVARDSLGAVTNGPTWSFTTAAGNSPPNVPSNPSPPHNSTTVATVDSSLSWTGGDPNGNPVTYDVYLNEGTSATTPRCTGVTVTTCPNASLGGLRQETRYSWRVVARDSLGAVTNGPTWTFTTTWKEHWFDHTQPLALQYQDAWVKVYHDPNVNSSAASWIPQYASRIVSYAHTAYGSMVSYPISVVIHQGRHHGGHAGYYYSAIHDNRNVVDMGANDWTDGPGNRDLIAHEISHVVESTSHGKHGSPTYGSQVWGDGPWPEFFIYDVAHHMAGLDPARYSGEPTRTYNQFTAAGNTHTNPVSGDPSMAPYRWFLNFFHPLWQNRGAAGMKEYYRLVGTYWMATGSSLSTMNMGQFVHFLSGAMQKDMKGLAAHAFGWPAAWETQLAQARTTFTAFTYPRCDVLPSDAVFRVYQDTSYGGSCLAFNADEKDLAEDFMLNGLVVNDNVSSFQIKPGWKVVVYEHANYTGATREYTADNPSLPNDPLTLGSTWNDRISSFKLVRVF